MSWETIRGLLRDEWAILSLLLLWSLAGLTIICERVYALWNVLPRAEAFKNRVVAAIETGDIAKANALCETANEPLADVFERGLRVFKKIPTKVTESVTSQRAVVVGSFKRYLWALGTVGSSAPFVGLFGTVGGIITAFQKLADPTKGGGGIGTVSAGIAEVLVTTAVGLGVAIIAVWFYNYFTARLDDITIDIDETASELVDTILRGHPA
jgi:biopolymer transport protein ExbB/TolQ